MKKLLLAALLVMGALSYGRDFEYREKRDIQGASVKHEKRMGRFNLKEKEAEGKLKSKNFERVLTFHRELERTERGHEGR